MRMETVSEKDMRPASKNRECFYCKKSVGMKHESNCVLLERNHTSCTVYVKNVETGFIKAFGDELYTPDGHDGLFIWREGNFACDCNRALFSGDDKPECGESKYEVNIEVEREIIYREF